jgi:CheY-like chemotaxis protein
METKARPTILIVEDEPFVQMLLSEFFAELGYAASRRAMLDRRSSCSRPARSAFFSPTSVYQG